MTSTIQIQKKKRSKILNKLLQELSPDFGKLQMKVDAVFEKARKEGFSDLEIGEFVRSQLQVSYSSRTIQRVLPDTAKHTEFANKADKMSASEHGKERIELPGDKVKVSKSLTDVEPKYVEGIDNDSYLPESPKPKPAVSTEASEAQESASDIEAPESSTVVTESTPVASESEATESLPAQEPTTQESSNLDQAASVEEETPFLAEKFGVDDFEIEKLNTYTLRYCRKVIRYFDEYQRQSISDVMKWDKRIHELAVENAALKAENAELKACIESWKKTYEVNEGRH